TLPARFECLIRRGAVRAMLHGLKHTGPKQKVQRKQQNRLPRAWKSLAPEHSRYNAQLIIRQALSMELDASQSTDPLLDFSGVALGYADFTVLKDINLRVHRGQVVAMMGGSGSGKTTLLRGATGQITAQRGTITAFGRNIAAASSDELRRLRQRMGVLFQQGALFTDLDVFENVAFPLREHTKI